jgi:hypothetical protein
MIELDAEQFLGSVREVQRLSTIAQRELGGADQAVDSDDRVRIAATIEELCSHLSLMGAQSAWVAASRFAKRLQNHTLEITYGEIAEPFRDIESRFTDHLQFIRLFVVRGEQMPLLNSPHQILGEPTASRFQDAWFDCEEAAKCILVQRPTAAVFHAMRILEIGIRAFAKRLGIDDPIRPAERNWGVILRKIKESIEARYPARERMAGSEGAFMERLYATLDAVKNPWRNETMHVEGVYQDAEARHILVNTIQLISTMATGFDQHGKPVDGPTLFAEQPSDEPNI